MSTMLPQPILFKLMFTAVAADVVAVVACPANFEGVAHTRHISVRRPAEPDRKRTNAPCPEEEHTQG